MRIRALIRQAWSSLPLGTKAAGFAVLLLTASVLAVTARTIQLERASAKEDLLERGELLLATWPKGLQENLYNRREQELREFVTQVARERPQIPELTRLKIYTHDAEPVERHWLSADLDQPGAAFRPEDADPADAALFQLPAGQTHFAWKGEELIGSVTVWAGTEKVGLVQIGLSTDPYEQRISSIFPKSLGVFVTTLVMGAALAVLAARQLTRPIVDLTQKANRLASLEGDGARRRLPEDEIAQLGRAFDEMASVLAKREADLRNLAQGLEKAVMERTLQLQLELRERERLETQMAAYQDNLEEMVRERTQELIEANAAREQTQRALHLEEERRRAYLASPAGRAEAASAAVLEQPANALSAVHALTQEADRGDSAPVLSELAGVFERAGNPLLARLAEGYNFIFRSQSEPELLGVGLRNLRSGLELPEAQTLRDSGAAALVYDLLHQAVDAQSIHAITMLLTPLRDLNVRSDSPAMLAGLVSGLVELLPVVEILHDFERVDTSQDQRAYLASAAEALTRAERSLHTLGAADRPILQRIVEDWLALVNRGLHDLLTRARISCRLLTGHEWDDDALSLSLRIRNDGQGAALNIRIAMVESSDYSPVEGPAAVDRLAAGEEAEVNVRIRPRAAGHNEQFRARFVITYDDPLGPNHIENFADMVHLLGPEPVFRTIPNPYVAGTPLAAGSPLFYGREDIFEFVEENLRAAHRNNLVLIGQRRTGKSSLLKQLPLRLGDEFVPIYLDGQSIVLDPGLPAFFRNLALEVCLTLQNRGFSIECPDLKDFVAQPAHTFERDFLVRVRTAIGTRHLVVMLDEFEELEAAVRRGGLDASIFGFLRHMVQHEPALSVIFCGTHRMEELTADYFGVLFNISLYKHVGFLEYEDAMRLIQEPVAGFGMRYDDLALDKMWRVTAGHPYFLQLLCHSVVNLHNRSGRSYVNVSQVSRALDDICSAGEAHFVYLWHESTREERLILTALSRMMPLTGRVTPVQVEDHLSEWGVTLDRGLVSEALHHLALRDILAIRVEGQSSAAPGTYSWQLGLLGLWIERYKSLSLLLEEEHRP